MATVTATKADNFISGCVAIATDMLKISSQHLWLDYDKEADVLYMSFRKPQRATTTIEIGDDILVRKNGKTIVGLTIMNASTSLTFLLISNLEPIR